MSTEAPKSIYDAGKANPRGIPQAPFVEKVEDFVKSPEEVEMVLNKFQDFLQKYKFMEANTLRRVAGLREKIPDIQQTLDMVKFLDSRKDSDEPFTTNYELNDTLYAKAAITPTKTVYLWLGANVMLEYPTTEAIELLQQRLKAANESLATCEEDLEFLKENITTMEVNTARVYNWDVQKRKELKAQEKE
ncbi:similar to Saccharomyces cerevisiae YGR078C PAC10 Part of the heteromeric co-chaperone GimC/prefoldin complex, which promotes efficient protein folding [Geotrichum candidum]|uniref:Prefoldin subunit 3 n=1 Tax=Geotrichum candidum TaxID=1173061 RepID=A0A0J9YHI3_GEOCN|nr:similar to Saccharomyces cerevisiae YGR078C PAC10 Part of the heteromeric co-chaperone GimC/prefoldin complex, which promotes efficient protein folding [Geotrichum candidum]